MTEQLPSMSSVSREWSNGATPGSCLSFRSKFSLGAQVYVEKKKTLQCYFQCYAEIMNHFDAFSPNKYEAIG